MVKAVSLAATVVLVAALLTMFFRKELLATGPVTLGLQVTALLLMVWARLTFGVRSFHATANATAGGLVTSGPYRYVRHPIYTAVLLFLWAGVAAHPGVIPALLACVATAMLVVRMLLEEQQLVLMYPEYRKYCEQTRRIVPAIL